MYNIAQSVLKIIFDLFFAIHIKPVDFKINNNAFWHHILNIGTTKS